MTSILTPRTRNSSPSKTMATGTGCSCLNSRSPKHGNFNLENSSHTKRKSVSVSQAISLAAAAASLAVILTALAASHFLADPWNSDIISSTTSNSIVSTTTRSTAYARARILESTLQASLRGKDRASLISTQENAMIASLSEGYLPIKSDELLQRSGRQQQSVAVSAVGDGAWPKVAWLMSFPNSGTSYTLHLTREATNMTTATNYALEGDIKDQPGVPIHEDASVAGPFLQLTHSRETTVPSTYILTKTHCGGFCSDCKPLNYIETPRSFQISCQSGRKATFGANGTLDTSLVTYDASLVKKSVHVIRNPLDNIVARFHLEWKRFKSQKNHDWITKYPYNSSGFNKWCENKDSLNEMSETRWVDPKLLDLLKSVPCQAEFYRYVQWHNLGFSITRDMGIPTLIIHYQDYRDDWENTLTRLLNFLELPRNGAGEPFDHGKEYRTYYSADQRSAIKAFIQEFSTTETWENVKDYEY